MNKANQIIDFAKQAIIESSSQTTLDAPINKRVAYAVSHGKSYASNGYAIRTHGIAAALNKRGFDTLCLIRPGRPWDFGAKREFSELQKEVDGVTYIHSPWENFLVPKDVFERVKVMALKYEELFKVYRPEIVLAASNYEVAFPAYIAAKKLGLPFHYEVRGFWEISRLSRDPDWEDSDGYHEQVELESFLVSNADKLYTLNTSMVQELVKRGANRASISLVPNAAPSVSNVESKSTKHRNEFFNDYEDTFLLGYVGALTDYEGIDTLLQAIASLKDEKVKLLVVGGNNPVNDSDKRDEVLERFKKQAIELGLQNQVVFTGRVAHEAVGNYIRAVDACVVPRKPDIVCELVSALKPLEYIAFNKPVIASNVAPQVELLANGKFGWLYEKGNVQSLCESITKLRSEDKRVIQEKLAAARKLIEEKLTWDCVVEPMALNLADSFKVSQPHKNNAGKKKVACIMDDFTFQSYSPEANLCQLTPDGYLDELTGFEPELLFIESAWRGKDELWGSKVGHRSQEVINIVEWCNKRKIPTVFWNKEDPIHFETFLNTAKLFDLVFTTDLDCVERYKAALGHDRVYFLPFACQPKLTNPIETFERKDAFSFAGAYYVKYPDRTRDLEDFIESFPSFKPVEIYDRNFGKNDPNYKFPKSFNKHIVGTLPFAEIQKAYKGYKYAINLNSIKQSQTMFARRVYELLGSNTVTVSNFSRGVRLMFGDLVQVSDSGNEIVRKLKALESNAYQTDKLRLAGLRKILSEHTYEDRFKYILQKAFANSSEHVLPDVVVFTLVQGESDLSRFIDNVKRQSYEIKKVVVLVDRFSTNGIAKKLTENAIVNFSVLSLDDVLGQSLFKLHSSSSWLTYFSSLDLYGSNYLLDIFLATRFTDALFIGKSSYFEEAENKLVLRHEGSSYKSAVNIPKRCCAISPLAQDIRLKDWLSDVTSGSFKEDNSQSIDIFNYCKNVTLKNEESFLVKVEDDDFDTGCSVRELQELSENIEAVTHTEDSAPHFDAKTLFEMFPRTSTKDCTITLDEEGMHISSSLEDGKHTYIYSIDKKTLSIDELSSQGEFSDEIPFHLEVTPGLNLSLVVIFFDVNMTRLHHEIIKPNKNNVLLRPDGAVYAKLGFRVYQSGQCTVKGLLLGEKDLSPTRLIGSSDTLLLTNHYPSYDDLYRNGFVHSRVAAYRERGVRVDTFRFRKDQPVTWHEFQNVDVTSGSAVALQRMLSSGQYKNLLVHFLDSDMWEVIEKYIDKINVSVWVHGAEIQPWWRREYNYTDEKLLELAKKQSDIRLGFWRSILNKMHKNLKLIFVSNYFAEEVMEDIGFRLPVDQYEIIHNPVDTDLFDYVPKPSEQRLKVLSIRPYASRKYANDLSVNAVLELSKQPFFNEFEFLFMGDGKLFDETLAPIAHFDNVKIERRFLAQTDIVKYHKEYGVFLCPTRMDAQGVSKDEAMSSGLVVISNAVTAIPEFIDEKSGLLSGGEDFKDMAESLQKLYMSKQLFTELSENSAKRARKQVGKAKIVQSELRIFNELG